MVQTIILCIACAIMAAFAICAFLLSYAEKKELKKLENELNERNKVAEKTAEKIAEANKIKADARTGDHSADIKYMADKLHNYANK